LVDSRSEDTIIFSALTPEHSDPNIIYDALKEFFEKKKEIDYNDRFNGIVFTTKGPQYLENFTLNPENLLKAMKSLEPYLSKANLAGGIFIALTFVAEVFKKISGKVYRLIILTDQGSSKIQEDQIFFIEDLLDKVKDMPFIMDVVCINTSDPAEELKLMKLARRTGGDIYEISVDFEKIKKEKEKEKEDSNVIEEKKPISVLEKLSKLSKTPLKLAKRIKSEIHEYLEKKEEKKDIDELSLTFDKLAEKKEVKLSEDYKINIPERNILFYESLADDLIKVELIEKHQCTICFTSVSKNRELMKCPSCQTYVHKICAAIWAKTSHIGTNTPYICRCHNCYNLIKMDENFVRLVNSTKTPILELFNVEDLVLEEYLQSIESKEGPKLITTEDTFSESQEKKEKEKLEEKEEFQYMAQDEVQIIWCENCGKMTSNEFINCPRCGEPLKSEKSLKKASEKESKKIKKIDIEQTQKEEKVKMAEIKDKFEYVKEKFEKLMDMGMIKEAHQMVERFKKTYKDILMRSTIPEIEDFLNLSDEAWREYTGESETGGTIETVLEEKDDIAEIKPVNELKEEEDGIQILKAQINKIENAFKSSSRLVEDYKFDEAISILKNTVSGINMAELKKYKIKLEEKITKIKELKNSNENKIIEYQEQFKMNKTKGFLNASLYFAENIAKLADKVGKIELSEKYKQVIDELKEKIDFQEKQAESEKEKIIEMVNKLEEFIKIELIGEDVLLNVEVISLNDVLGKTLNNHEEIINFISSLLKKNRGLLTFEIERNALLKSESGEIVELIKKIPIQKSQDLLNFESNLSIVNPFDESVKEVLIRDIIPYNFRLLNIKLNGKNLKKVPIKRLRKNGLELTWNLNEISPNDSIEIYYTLQKRVSRAIILVIDNIIYYMLSHYDISKENNSKFYEVILPFNIVDNKKLKLVIIEDIIPSTFIPVIIEPKDLTAVDTSNFKGGKLIGWILDEIELGAYLYYYKLINKEQFVEIKKNLEKKFNEGLKALGNNDLIKAIKKSKEISDFAKETLK